MDITTTRVFSYNKVYPTRVYNRWKLFLTNCSLSLFKWYWLYFHAIKSFMISVILDLLQTFHIGGFHPVAFKQNGKLKYTFKLPWRHLDKHILVLFCKSSIYIKGSSHIYTHFIIQVSWCSSIYSLSIYINQITNNSQIYKFIGLLHEIW